MYKTAFIKAVLKEKKPIIRALIKKAKSGDVQALKEINDRVLGKPFTFELPPGGNGELKIKWQS